MQRSFPGEEAALMVVQSEGFVRGLLDVSTLGGAACTVLAVIVGVPLSTLRACLEDCSFLQRGASIKASTDVGTPAA